jgi:Bardet-Biedl syndrome 7 protein
LLHGSELVYEVEVAGPPKCTTLYGAGQSEGEDVLYGTQNGRIGLVQLGSEEPVYHWDIDNERREGGVTCLAVHDVLLDGVPDVLVGRDDGIVQLYSFDESEEPVLKFSHSFPESISSVAGGYVGSADHKEIVVGTYNGQIVGMTSRTSLHQAEIISSETRTKIAALKEDIALLEERIKGARERYKENITSSDKDMISAIPKFDVNDRFQLNQDEAWYTLSIETQVPLDTIILQSNVPLDIQEVDKSVAVVSYTPPDIAIGNYVLVTYRLSGATRLEVKVRTIEGQHGTVQAYIIPTTEPKTCVLQKYFVKPLSLHQRIHTFDDARPYNTLSITGNFTLGDAHAWLRFCLPDVPEHIPVDEEAILYFKGVFTGTQLECSYKQGSLAFRTDNMSTLTVLKDVLSKEATERNIAVKITFELNQDSVPHMLRLIFPLLEHQLMLAKNVQLIEALQEIKIAESDIGFMPPQWKLILDNAELIQSEFKMQPCMVERIYALITDLYMDRANFKGENVKSKVSQLLETLEGCELESILAFFEAS